MAAVADVVAVGAEIDDEKSMVMHEVGESSYLPTSAVVWYFWLIELTHCCLRPGVGSDGTLPSRTCCQPSWRSTLMPCAALMGTFSIHWSSKKGRVVQWVAQTVTSHAESMCCGRLAVPLLSALLQVLSWTQRGMVQHSGSMRCLSVFAVLSVLHFAALSSCVVMCCCRSPLSPLFFTEA